MNVSELNFFELFEKLKTKVENTKHANEKIDIAFILSLSLFGLKAYLIGHNLLIIGNLVYLCAIVSMMLTLIVLAAYICVTYFKEDPIEK